MVVHWPDGITETGGLRGQFGHVIDIAPTILEAANLPEPTVVNGTPQTPMEGVSLVYTFDDAEAAERHTTQYFEIFGNRAIYRDGWFAQTLHRAPWQITEQQPLESDVWELYDTRDDFILANDLADEHPERLAELEALFMTEAEKYHVLPIDDRVIERLNPALAGRPDLMDGRTSLTLYDGMSGMLENTFINVKNQSKTITAEVEIPAGGGEGVILAQGGRFAGWSLYMKDGRISYVHNWVGKERYTITAPEILPAGHATIRYEFAYEGGDEAGMGGTGTLYVNGQQVAEGRIERTTAFLFSADETADVGVDEATPVTDAYAERHNAFNGTIEKVTVELQ